MAKVKADKILTPEFRVCFPALFKKPIDRKTGKEGKFGLKAVFEKKADLKALKIALLNHVKASQPKIYEQWLKMFKERWPSLPQSIAGYGQPFRDGDEKTWAGFADSVYITIGTMFKPQVVNRKLEEIIDPDEVYAGCYGVASIVPNEYPAQEGGLPGFNFFLSNFMKTRDGERLGGSSSAEEDFASLKEQAEAEGADNDDSGLN